MPNPARMTNGASANPAGSGGMRVLAALPNLQEVPMPKVAPDGSGMCARCGRDDWVSATWVDGEGTVCSRCLPLRRKRKPVAIDGAAVLLEVAQLFGQAEGPDGPGRHLTQAEAAAAYPGRLSPWYGEATPEPQAAGCGSVGFDIRFRGAAAVKRYLASVRLPNGQRISAEKISATRVAPGYLGSVWRCETNVGRLWVSFGAGGWRLSRTSPEDP